MLLPFTHDQFLDTFGGYNAALWPVALLLWIASAIILVLVARRARGAGLAATWLLAVLWSWSAVAYHLAWFRAINPVATVFALAFLVQAALFLWRATPSRALEFDARAARYGTIGMALAGYALLYPALGLLGMQWPRVPSYGVPCPTGILTAGFLLMTVPAAPRPLAILPILWGAIGGSAAIALGIRADFALTVAMLMLVGWCVMHRPRLPVARRVPGAGA